MIKPPDYKAACDALVNLFLNSYCNPDSRHIEELLAEHGLIIGGVVDVESQTITLENFDKLKIKYKPKLRYQDNFIYFPASELEDVK